MIRNPEASSVNFLSIGVQSPASKSMLEVLSRLGIPFRNSLHDAHEDHQVIEVNHGYLEFYTQEKGEPFITLAIESENLEKSLGALPDGFKILYKGDTELDNYNAVIVCEYSQDFQVKIYEKKV